MYNTPQISTGNQSSPRKSNFMPLYQFKKNIKDNGYDPDEYYNMLKGQGVKIQWEEKVNSKLRDEYTRNIRMNIALAKEAKEKASQWMYKYVNDTESLNENYPAKAQAVTDFVWWAVAEVPQVAWNMFETARKVVIWMYDKLWIVPDDRMEEIEQEAKNIMNLRTWAKDWIQNMAWVDSDSTATKVGEFATEMWASLATPNPFSKIKAWSKIANIGVKALEGATDVATYNAYSEWDIDMKEVWVWAALWPVLSWAATAVSKWAKALANKLQLSWLLNPKKLEYVAKALKETWDDVDNVANWMFERDINWSKDAIVKKLNTVATQSKNKVKTVVANATWTHKPQSIWWALDELIDTIWTPKSTSQKKKLEEINILKSKFDSDGLTLEEVQKVKESMDDILDIYTIAGDAKAWAKKADLAGLRRDIRGFIEDTATSQWLWDVKAMNKDVAVSKQLSKFINYKDKTDAVRDMLSPFASPFAWWVMGAVYGWDYESAIKWVLFWAGVWSTATKTNIANVLNKMTVKQKKTALQELVKWNTGFLWKKLQWVFISNLEEDDSQSN